MADIEAHPADDEVAPDPFYDAEAVGWALTKLRAFGVANNTMENALMFDRLEAMHQEYGRLEERE